MTHSAKKFSHVDWGFCFTLWDYPAARKSRVTSMRKEFSIIWLDKYASPFLLPELKRCTQLSRKY